MSLGQSLEEKGPQFSMPMRLSRLVFCIMNFKGNNQKSYKSITKNSSFAAIRGSFERHEIFDLKNSLKIMIER